MRFVLLVACLTFLAQAEIVDRIAITVGRQAITERQVDEEIRVTAFLNHASFTLSPAERTAAAQHLIEQLLVRREMEVSRYPLPLSSEIDRYIAQVKESFGAPLPFDAALKENDLTEDVLKEHLTLQLTLLHFIEFRFKPEVNVTEQAIGEEYGRETAEWRRDHSGTPPTLPGELDRIREILAERQTDELLEAWLKRDREALNVVFLDRSLQ